MSSLTNLTSLDLWGSGVTDFSALSGLTNLTSLKLGGSSLTDISTVSSLTNLTSLDLIGSGVTDISALSGLTNLTTLTLEGNGVTDFSALSSLTNLTSLDLGGSGVTDISALSRLTKLKTLNLGFVAARDLGLWDLTCHPLGKWTFDRSYPPPGVPHPLNSQLRDRTPRLSNISALSGLTNLTWLNLSGQNITDISALSGLTKLTHLYLGGGTRVDATAGTSLGQTANVRSDVSFPREHQTVNCGPLPDALVSNSISDLSPLVSNTGLGTGDMVDLGGNWLLSYASIYTHIPALKARGVTVSGSINNRVPTTLTKVSGDAQTGATSTALANPFVVEVKDGGHARIREVNGGVVYSSDSTAPDPFARVPVTFAVTGGGGTLSATTVATDATGRAQTTLTPGSTTGTNTVTATVTHAGRTLSVSFTANANNRHPTFTSADTFSVAENTTTVGTVVATDADSQDSITGYTLSGADSAKFAITNAGVLTFAAAPNYEAPGDLASTEPANAAGNNEYIIVVTATSGSGARQLTATQTLTITVTDVNEAPGQPAPPTVATVAATPTTSLRVNWTAATNTGPAITYNLRYRKSSEVSWTPSTYADSAISTTLTGLAPGTSYEVQVLAKNTEGDGPWSESGTGTTAYQTEDIDRSGDVDINDLVSVISNFGSASPGRNDVDGDGDVDAADIRAVFAALLAANAGAPAHLTHTAKTLQDYVRQAEQRGMLDANFQQGLAVLEALLEPFLIPNETALLRNYPNPFNPETWIPYQLSKPADVTFSIYSVNGRLVRTLSLGYQAAGVYRHRSRAAYWDGRNALGEPVASGVYFYTLTAGAFIATGKMLIRK